MCSNSNFVSPVFEENENDLLPVRIEYQFECSSLKKKSLDFWIISRENNQIQAFISNF